MPAFLLTICPSLSIATKTQTCLWLIPLKLDTPPLLFALRLFHWVLPLKDLRKKVSSDSIIPDNGVISIERKETSTLCLQ